MWVLEVTVIDESKLFHLPWNGFRQRKVFTSGKPPELPAKHARTNFPSSLKLSWEGPSGLVRHNNGLLALLSPDCSPGPTIVRI